MFIKLTLTTAAHHMVLLGNVGKVQEVGKGTGQR